MKIIFMLMVSMLLTSQAQASGCMGYRSSYELGSRLKTEEVSGQFSCGRSGQLLSCVFITEENQPRKFSIYMTNPSSRLPEGFSFPVVIESFEAMEYDDCTYDGRYLPNGTYERFFVGDMEISRFIPYRQE